MRKRLRNTAKAIAFGLSDFGLLPTRLKQRAAAGSIFRGRALRWDDRGFWMLEPMPSPSELDAFYSNTYWGQVGVKSALVEPRDVDHLALLTSHIPELRTGKLRCLNFGAGHGGISYLLHAMGHEIVNVEPSGVPLDLGRGWAALHGLDQVTGEFDLIYASHSVEHVLDLDKVMATMSELLAPTGYVFFEVPNCRQSGIGRPVNGGQDGTTRPPHTYYFTLDYFATLESEALVRGTFLQATFPNTMADAEAGDVIRYLGRGRLQRGGARLLPGALDGGQDGRAR